MSLHRTVVLGTHNRKKAAELAALLNGHGFDVQTLADFSGSLEIDETGDSFAANAALKATEQARHLGHWVLGEDSGLVVDVLDGVPGIFSARFAGPRADDDENNRYLLARLEGRPPEQRSAHYVCHMTLADTRGVIQAESEARCHGRIRDAMAGTSGFGYDPLFEVVEYHRTFGELGDAVKSAISHRSRAARLLLPQLIQLVAANAWPLSD